MVLKKKTNKQFTSSWDLGFWENNNFGLVLDFV